MKTKSNINLILTGLILAIFMADLSAQFNFTDVTGEPVLTYGDPGEWDDGAVWNPAVIKDGDTLRMWYGGLDKSIWENPGQKIGYAWSLDGITWTKYDDPTTSEAPYANSDPVLEAEILWEGEFIFQCAVIQEADTFKMWYGAGDSQKIGYAWSLNCKNWTKHPEPVLERGPESDWDDAIIAPHTVIKEESEYKMWYWAGRPGFPSENSYPQVGLATSPDGITWTKYDDPTTSEAPYANSDPVLKVGLPGDWDSHRTIESMVMKTETGYFMMYQGLKTPLNTSTPGQIGSASSTDGITWTKYNDPATENAPFANSDPIIKDDNSFVEWGKTIYNGTVIIYEGQYHYWFACFHTPPYQARPQTGYGISPTMDVIDLPEKNLQFQLYPNPFSSSSTIEYELTLPGIVSITIYNHLGVQIEAIREKQLQGLHKFEWNAEGIPAGLYFCVLKTNEGIQTAKMIKL